jgi:hypothetical protein
MTVGPDQAVRMGVSCNASIEGSQASDVGSIPIARSINPVDAVGFTGFLHPKFPIKTRVLDAAGRGFRPPAGISDATNSGIFHLISDYVNRDP